MPNGIARTLAQRHGNINGTGVGPRLSGSNVLQYGVTAFNDSDVDKATGSAGIDWFFLDAGDTGTDFKGGEFLN